ncbi:MAG: ATP-binding protein [Candidatus Atribacteria bacterium]|nr:ATP-binding protein [Candidatus Atribacteria bacterium]
MKFLNRKKEIAGINKSLSFDEARLIVVYGRRRLGKTRLLQQIKGNKTLYFVADQREKTMQIESFVKTLSSRFSGFDSVKYPDWESVFYMLNQHSDEKFVLIIDEFPYLVKNAPELPSLFQKIFDSRDNLKYHLVVCGSSQQMMHKLVMDYTAPLYGRADIILKIGPMNIFWIKEALQCSYIEAVEEFSVWGGVPRYWEIREKEQSLKEAVINQLFDVNGLLYEEPFRLFLDDTNDIVQMSTIISIIASGANRLSEVASRIAKPSTHLNRPLNKLIELGYLKREIPFGLNDKNAKKTLYKINDPFISFYYKFVVPNKSAIEIGIGSRIFEEIVAPQLPMHYGSNWEELCRNSIPFLFPEKLFNPGKRCWGTNIHKQQSEIDIIASSNDGTELIIAEAKWSSNINVNALIQNLEKKVEGFQVSGKVKKVHKVLFLKELPTKIKNDIIVFTPEQVINSSGDVK